MSLKTNTTTYELYNSGALDYLIQKGLISTTIVFYCKIYKAYLYQKDLGKKYLEAIEIVANDLCVTERTVRRALNKAVR